MDTDVALGGSDAQAWLAGLKQSLEVRPGYQVSATPDSVTVSRTYLSDNRLVGGLILGFFTAGLGWLLLTRRDTEEFTVTLSAGEAAKHGSARISGECSGDTLALISSLAGRMASPLPAPSPDTVTPQDHADDPVEVREAEVREVEVREVEEPAAVVVEDEPMPPDATRRVKAPQDPVPVLVVRLDDGQQWSLASRNVVGRAPSASPGEDVQLIEISDEEQSISKNHARIDVLDGGILVIDLNSTNGTVVIHPTGDRQIVDTQAGVVADVGAVIELGERKLTLITT